MKRLAIAMLGFALGAAPTLTQACNFVPERSLCGLPLSASAEQFSAKLGQPDAQLSLSNARQGLLYGQYLLLVFKNEQLLQIQSWARAEPAFLAELASAQQRPLRLILDGFSPWSRSRQQLDLALENRHLLHADAHQQTRIFGHSLLTLRYRANEADEPVLYQLDQLQLDLAR